VFYLGHAVGLVPFSLGETITRITRITRKRFGSKACVGVGGVAGRMAVCLFMGPSKQKKTLRAKGNTHTAGKALFSLGQLGKLGKTNCQPLEATAGRPPRRCG